jgi:hypothetical protein
MFEVSADSPANNDLFGFEPRGVSFQVLQAVPSKIDPHSTSFRLQPYLELCSTSRQLYASLRWIARRVKRCGALL